MINTAISEECGIRILHVTSALDPGGIETWLLRLAQYSGDARLMQGILVLGDHVGLLDEQFRRLGVRVLRTEGHGNWIGCAWVVARALQESGPWDVIHSHVHRRSAVILLVAALCGVPFRIAHSHNNNQVRSSRVSWLRRPFEWLASQAINALGNQRIACSVSAAKALFGKAAAGSSGYVHIPYGIDEQDFNRRAHQQIVARSTLGIPEGAVVVGHVGRFMRQKNHEFLLHTAAEMLRHRSDLHFLLVGDGPLRKSMEHLSFQLGIHNRVTFTGNRLDVPGILAQCMDCFFFPSRWEGLGIVMLEAQLAGLPCFYSDVVPPEADVFPEGNQAFSLGSGPKPCARQLLAFLSTTRSFRRKQERRTLSEPYRIASNAAILTAIYRRGVPSRRVASQGTGNEQLA